MDEVGLLIIPHKPKTCQLLPAVMPLGFVVGGLLEFSVIGDQAIVVTVNQNCPLCGRMGVKEYLNRWVCFDCVMTCRNISKKRRRKKSSETLS